MNRIKAYTEWNDSTRTHYYTYFDIVDTLPKIGDYYNGNLVIDVENVDLDCEQGNDEVYSYNYYEIVADDGEEEYTENVAILKELDV